MEMTAVDTSRAAETGASFTASRADLAPALDFLARIVERRNTIPILSHILLTVSADGVALQASDLDMFGTVEIAADVHVPGRFTLELETLRDFVRKVDKGASLTLTASETRVAIAAGRARSQLATLKPDDFPTFARPVDAPAAFDGCAATWLRDLERVSRAVSTEETRYYLNGVYAHREGDSLALVATDGHRLVRVIRPLPEGAGDMPGAIIPRKAVAIICRMLKSEGGDFRAWFAPARMALAIGRYRLDSRLVDGTFPQYQRVIPDEAGLTHSLTIDAGELLAMTEGFKRGRAGTASADVLAIDLDEARSLYGKAGGDGAFSAELACTYSGPAARIGFNAGYLRDVATVLPSGALLMRSAGPDSAYLVQSAEAPEVTLVQMPYNGREEPLPEPRPARDVPAYQAPDGQACDLWGIVPHGAELPGSLLSSLCHERPRAAAPAEVEAYARDYARRCALPGADSLPVAPLGEGRVQFGARLSVSRTEIVERLNWETLTVEKETVTLPDEYEPGAFCLTLPGGGRQAPVTVSIDGGAEQEIAADHSGDIRKALTAIMGPDIKLSRAEKARLRAGNRPADPEPVAPVARRVVKAATAKRATRALEMLSGARAGMGTRAFDDCFEMFDGDAVAALMVERIRADRELAWRIYYGKRRVRDGDERFDVYARSYLSPALWAAVLDSIGNMPTSIAPAAMAEAIDAHRIAAPAPVEPAAPEASEEPAPDERDISAPEPVEAPSEPDSAPLADVSADQDPAPAQPAAPDGLADRIAALESVVQQLLAERAAEPEAREPAPAVLTVDRRRDPARLRMIRRYLAMRAERERLRAQLQAASEAADVARAELREALAGAAADRSKRATAVLHRYRARRALRTARAAERSASAEARAAMSGMLALTARADQLQARVDQLEGWDEERPAFPAPRRFEVVR